MRSVSVSSKPAWVAELSCFPASSSWVLPSRPPKPGEAAVARAGALLALPQAHGAQAAQRAGDHPAALIPRLAGVVQAVPTLLPVGVPLAALIRPLVGAPLAPPTPHLAGALQAVLIPRPVGAVGARLAALSPRPAGAPGALPAVPCRPQAVPGTLAAARS